MSDDLWNDLQYMVLGRDDPELFIPYQAYVGVLATNRCVQFRFRTEVRTVRFIANTLGAVVTLDFNEETTTQINFLRVKIRLDITERLRFFRRACFEPREGAMVGFEYEKLKRVFTNRCRMNHQASHCLYLAPPVVPNDESDVLVVPVWQEGEGSNNINRREHENNSLSSNISSYTPISQAPLPASPVLNWDEYTVVYHPQRLSSSNSQSILVEDAGDSWWFVSRLVCPWWLLQLAAEVEEQIGGLDDGWRYGGENVLMTRVSGSRRDPSLPPTEHI
ncbi:Zinc knuckle CX2CX4HX4C [Arabidopsis suecica]|uniref:Zinc knuckle CX2CX4HX4C n=1 Tax=Arabidopsis suecica TaxID=45249 RepID=A0A8T2BAQ7_ARASU|nr:Zinc knuckle CX2CX4HX4C [Arabidopsis suecica]